MEIASSVLPARCSAALRSTQEWVWLRLANERPQRPQVHSGRVGRTWLTGSGPDRDRDRLPAFLGVIAGTDQWA